MSDKELLVLAAKAAGYVIDYDVSSGTLWVYPKDSTPDADGEYPIFLWNPLTDDGDALRLAVKVLNWPYGGRAFDTAVCVMSAVGQFPSDPYEATRRAIVRAAAEIGRKMP